MTAPWWATGGVVVAWAVHDLEEGLTFPGWTHTASDRLAAAGYPKAARTIRRSPAEGWLAIGLFAIPVAVAAWRGHRSGGRDRYYQSFVQGHGLHAISHLGASVVLREYTPGVVTAPLFAGAYSTAARRAVERSGVAWRPSLPMMLGLLAGLPVAHAVARALLGGVRPSRDQVRRRSRSRRPR